MLKEEIDRLRARYHGFEHMMHQAWFKWDSATNKVSIDATKDVWEDFTEKYKCATRYFVHNEENYAIFIELFFLEVHVEDDSFVDVSGRTFRTKHVDVDTRCKLPSLYSNEF
ncbi:hypothetical protein M9H77_35087 [Catharanthus roseus]|uniref:Uncharacterized protein n=1 Tax=Catharanthus roseus TaxID=4058 RepID=A0ACB9ZS94_CATRO|nr:hypothetical protein M9H77_35087 [Catharanthus roseus]